MMPVGFPMLHAKQSDIKGKTFNLLRLISSASLSASSTPFMNESACLNYFMYSILLASLGFASGCSSG